MKLNSKIAGLLITSFLVISALFVGSSVSTLKQNQENNLAVFTKEFLEHSLELTQKNSATFFTFLDRELKRRGEVELEEIQTIIAEIDPFGLNTVLYDTKILNFVPGYENSPLSHLLTKETVSRLLKERESTGETHFQLDNYEDFHLTKATPTKINLRLYDDLSLLIGHGTSITTGKARLGFIEKQNETLFKRHLRTLIIIFIATIFLVTFSAIFFMRKTVVKPIKQLIQRAQTIAEGDLSQNLKLKSKDEIGELGKVFNKMTRNLRGTQKELKDTNKSLEKKVKARTKALEKEKVVAVKKEEEITLKNALLLSQYDSSPDGIVAFSNEGEIMSYNQPFMAIWKIPKVVLKEGSSEKIIQHISKQVKNSNEFIRMVKHLTEHKDKVGRHQIELIDERIIDMQAHPLKGQSGKYYGRVWYFRDITKEAEIDRAKTEFVSLASHQLRTPLTSVKWLLQKMLKQKKDLTREHAEFLGDALTSTDRTIELVNDLLNLSRLEAGMINVDPKKTNLTKLVGQLIKEFKKPKGPMATTKDKNQKIQFKKPSKAVIAYLDPQLISQVISNLLSNAIYYSEPNTHITVILEKDKNSVKVSVKDQGVGISKSDQKKLFTTKFFRSAEAAKHSTTGSGLGLYVVKKVLKICDGTIACHSTLGKGSTFVVVLPLKGLAHKGP